MSDIKQTIQQSHVLSDQQKINLLVEIDECSQDEMAKLGDVLTHFEEQYHSLLATYQEAVNKELAGILSDDGDVPAVREAVEKIRMGVKTLQA